MCVISVRLAKRSRGKNKRNVESSTIQFFSFVLCVDATLSDNESFLRVTASL